MLFTGVLGGSTILLWWETRKGGETNSRLVDVAERQLAIQGLQTDVLQKQHAIGRLQFLAQHRPRLRIRHVQLMLSDRIVYGAGDVTVGGLVVVNTGSTKATIVESRYVFLVTDSPLPTESPLDNVNATAELLYKNQVLEVAESCAVPIRGTIPKEYSALTLISDDVYVMGQVRYRDEGGAERFMGFCRKRGSDGHFRAVDDPDYEYED